MDEQGNDYIQATNYERSNDRINQRNGYYDIELITHTGNLELKVPQTCDGECASTVFRWYQRNKMVFLTSLLEMYISGITMHVKSLKSLRN